MEREREREEKDSVGEMSSLPDVEMQVIAESMRKWTEMEAEWEKELKEIELNRQ